MGSNESLLFIAIAVAIALTAGGLLSRLRVDRDATFRDEAAALRDQTTPPDGAAEPMSAVDRREFGARVFWNLSVTQPWPDYCAWVRTKLTNYQLSEESENRFVLTCEFEGDTLRVYIDRVSSGPPANIRITFDALAN